MAIIEYTKDLKPYIPRLIEDMREAVEANVFITYPRGLAHHLYSKEEGYSEKMQNPAERRKLLKRLNRLWNSKGFPRIDGEVKGVYLNDLNEFLKR